MDWDEEYDLLAAGRSFIDRARNAPDDEDTVIEPPSRPDDASTFTAGDETPLQQLIRHWIDERNCPDILPAQEELLVNILDHIRRQVGYNSIVLITILISAAGQSQTVQLLREDSSTSEDEHIRIMLAQTEMERVKFIVRSYVRTRHFKVSVAVPTFRGVSLKQCSGYILDRQIRAIHHNKR